MFCDDFIRRFEEQNPDFKWAEVQSSIFRMFRYSIGLGSNRLFVAIDYLNLGSNVMFLKIFMPKNGVLGLKIPILCSINYCNINFKNLPVFGRK
jgi:hypothetical protein